jgi:divalent metal cation (Fe/Co/Zn/Cd) transporter
MKQKPSALKVLRILYFALLIGMLMFAGISYFISQVSEPPIADRETYKLFSIIILVVSFVCVVISANLFKRDISRIKQLGSLPEKLEQYRASAIRTWAMIEGAALLAIIFFFLTHQLQLLMFAGLLVFVYLVYYPTSNKIASQVEESAADIENLEA